MEVTKWLKPLDTRRKEGVWGAIIGQRQNTLERHHTSCLGWRSSASSTRFMIPMRSITVSCCGPPSYRRMQYRSQQPVCVHFRLAGRVFRRCLLFVHIRTRGTARVCPNFPRFAIERASLRRDRRLVLDILHVHSDHLHPCFLHLLCDIRPLDTVPSDRRLLALQVDAHGPDTDACMKWPVDVGQPRNSAWRRCLTAIRQFMRGFPPRTSLCSH